MNLSSLLVFVVGMVWCMAGITVLTARRKNCSIPHSAGIEAIIVGVFAEGLDESWLGRRLDADAKKELLKLKEKYGVSIMGEGGEYESMTLDSPVHRKRLVIADAEKVMSRNAGTYDVSSLKLEEKN